ncbi:uncharacterized protein CC84DRAFT_175350 [Paraphaeosphaeria sporulosa]|uniref:Uncharacterized protein n=1 Tax=Paraphaeosphaeria sporulosa TaxID=1460663 RepID=A0A177D0H8_9PLEO|nr:uncharacterized protein CC84DRAFT_175350 [Paraphaeosphaeria sporulosa]OAG13026.1 hypothetical protein CC84DRAFT_175350 [Paraphaeosphaeria sporulosa]
MPSITIPTRATPPMGTVSAHNGCRHQRTVVLRPIAPLHACMSLRLQSAEAQSLVAPCGPITSARKPDSGASDRSTRRAAGPHARPVEPAQDSGCVAATVEGGELFETNYEDPGRQQCSLHWPESNDVHCSLVMRKRAVFSEAYCSGSSLPLHSVWHAYPPKCREPRCLLVQDMTTFRKPTSSSQDACSQAISHTYQVITEAIHNFHTKPSRAGTLSKGLT